MTNDNLPPDLENLWKVLPRNYSISDRDLVRRAYEVAKAAHGEQKRVSGEPYVTHCVAVAQILAEMGAPAEVVAAAMLHDTLEDTSLTFEDLQRDFGLTVAKLVDGVTKLTKLPRVSRDDQHADAITNNNGDNGNNEAEKSDRKQDLMFETLRKTFLAMGEDIRVILIKLADRLHNMRTLHYLPEAKRRRIAQQTLDIFAPLANRLGIWQIKWELEDLAFRYTQPDKYKEIAKLLAERRAEREANLQTIIESIRNLLKQHNIQAEVSGRPKHIYSIYRKMIRKDKPFELLRDIRGVRLIVPDIPTCYMVLGLIHTHWRPIHGEFDDYIANPKSNNYQSLHTAVIWDDGKPLEVQIRTPEMHEKAELGVAAHWRYKEGREQDPSLESYLSHLRAMLLEWKQEVPDAREYVEAIKTDVFQDRVYVFTPKGDIIDLPKGSTPIDFAYHIHTDIGHRCRGARVNGQLVPLNTELKTGDRVEILTTKRGGPSRDWLNPHLKLVHTERARSKIRAWFKKEAREKNLASGRAILERELHRLGIEQINLEKLARALNYKHPDDMFVALGCGDLQLTRIVRCLSETPESVDVTDLPGFKPLRSDNEPAPVVGLQGMLTTVAKCCHPTPGDEIIGYITRGRGVSIHRQDCPNILRTTDRERLIRIAWGEKSHLFHVPIRIVAYDRTGLIKDISSLLNQEGINILDISVHVVNGLAYIQMVIEVKNTEQLSSVLTQIENIQNVLQAQRVRPG